MVDCALGDMHPPGFSSRLHVVGKRYVVAPYVVPGQDHHDDIDVDGSDNEDGELTATCAGLAPRRALGQCGSPP